MRESKFIEQNKKKWEKYENSIPHSSLLPDEMERAYVELNDDLSYARTFYKRRAVRIFLNDILASLFIRIHRSQPWSVKGFLNFFTHTAPSVLNYARGYLLVSLLTVLLGVFIGYFGTKHQVQFATLVLGYDYVKATEANINAGDPLAVYKYQNAGDMFQFIAVNNIKVALNFVIFGVFFCIGALFLLLNNGIMLGVFTYLFTSKGLSTEYFLTVYQHGTMEILGMVVEGAAGIMLGAGFLFPGNLPRLVSLKLAAKRSVVLLLVCVPIVILAAFIESYLTRFTDIPDAFRFLFIFISFAFMVFYFVVYPYLQRNKIEINSSFDGYTSAMPIVNSNNNTEKANPLSMSFLFLRNHIVSLLLAGFFVMGLFWLLNFLSDNPIQKEISFIQLLQFSDNYSTHSFANPVSFLYQSCNVFYYLFTPALSNNLIFSGTSIFIFGLYLATIGQKNFQYHTFKMILLIFGLSTLLSAFLLLFFNIWPLILCIGYPIIIVLFTEIINSKEDGGRVILSVFILFFRRLNKWIVSFIIGITMCFLFYVSFILICYLFISNSEQFHGYSPQSKEVMKLMIYACIGIMPLAFAWLSVYIMNVTFEQSEFHSGRKLFQQIDEMKTKTQVYGLDIE